MHEFNPIGPDQRNRTRSRTDIDVDWRIAQIVASGLEHEVKDPRLTMVTITDAKVTGDLRDATVYYTVYGTDTERADSAAALDSAKGIIRSEVGKRTGGTLRG